MSRGFTLVELCVVLAIVGLISGFGMQMATTSNSADCTVTTRTQLEELRAALNRYTADYGAYPKPSPRNKGPGDAGFGVSVTVGTDPAIDRVLFPQPVLIGGFPHKTMGIDIAKASDCWGNKYTYAVTEALTTPAGMNDPLQAGAITIKHGTLASPSTLSSNASYVLISHGADALGASPLKYSGPKRYCNSEAADIALLRIDKENCDTTNALFFAADYNPGPTAATYFDDIVSYGEKPAAVPLDCEASTVTWGAGCSAPALLTLAGLSVNVTNIASGYTGTAISTCAGGTRQTLGVCLPIGVCTGTNPRGGLPLTLLTGTSMNFGTGVCKKHSCCSGTIYVNNLSPCPLVDLPGIASCP